MAPPGRTVLVAEYFCFAGDATWNADDRKLAELTSHHLERLGLIRPGQVLGSRVVRAPQAYPIPSLGYQGHLRLLGGYLAGLTNLRLLGRTGGFRYLNMDEVLRDGLDAARELAGIRGAAGKAEWA
jgi:protoporphyrinogen oxidase